VAFPALDRLVAAGQLERGPRVAELDRRELLGIDAVARFTGRADLAEVYVLVAGRAVRGQVLELPAVHRDACPHRYARRAGHVTARARHTLVAPAEELGHARVRERRDAEGHRRVAGLAGFAEFGLVHVGVAGRARDRQPTEIDDARRLGAGGRVLVALCARQLFVRARQREPGAGCMVERAAPEAGLIVTTAAILLERPAVRVLVARRAAIELQGRLKRRPRVTLRTGDIGVFAAQGEGRSRVIDALRLPRVVRVAGGAHVAHRVTVRTLVAVDALRELQALEHLVHVALRALHGAVGAGELERGLRMVEPRAGLLERHGGRMADAAVGPETRLVDVRVAGAAHGRRREERPRLVALGAFLCDGGVAAVQWEPGLG